MKYEKGHCTVGLLIFTFLYRPPPVNGQGVFFSEKCFKLYSGTPDFSTYLAEKQKQLGWKTSEEEMIMSQGFENKNIYAEKPTKDVTKKASANVKVK